MKLYNITFDEFDGILSYAYVVADNIRDAYDILYESRLDIKSIDCVCDDVIINKKNNDCFIKEVKDLCYNIIDLSQQRFFDAYYIKRLANDADNILKMLEK